MKFIIQEWPNQSATLMTANGYILATFNTLSEARHVCEEWHKVHKRPGDRKSEQLLADPSQI